MEGFSSASLFPTRKWEAITQGGIRGIDHTSQRRTQEIYIGWDGGSLGSIIGGVRRTALVLFLFNGMYLECVRGVDSPPSF